MRFARTPCLLFAVLVAYMALIRVGVQHAYATRAKFKVINERVSRIPVRYIQIFGERVSGTNYIEELLRCNMAPGVNISFAFGYKHWYACGTRDRGEQNNTTDTECARRFAYTSQQRVTRASWDDTLFLIIVRDPYDWLVAMHRSPYHAADHSRVSFYEFLRRPWHSYERKKRHDSWPLAPSRPAYYFIERARHVCDLRVRKMRNWLEIARLARHSAFMRYEDARDFPESTISRLVLRPLGMPVPPQPHGFVRVDERRQGDVKQRLRKYVPRQNVTISGTNLAWINAKLNWSAEALFNYARTQ